MKAALRFAAGASVLAAAVAVSAAQASESHRKAHAPLLRGYLQECGACHVAYPPVLLPAASWERLMGNLPRHFGSDASLDPAAAQSIGQWLRANAAETARSRRATLAPPPEDRITRSAWFLREHRELAPAVWDRPAVKGPSNCAACHPRATEGAFDEHDIRIPR